MKQNVVTGPAYARVAFDAVADAAAVVVAGKARFTVLTPRLIRMEYSADGHFEDRPSQVFWHRRQPVPPFEARREGDGLTLTTEALRLVYRGGDFAPDSLSVALLPDGPTWRYGDRDAGNLRGTTRTLDTIDGGVPLDPGLLSRDGWVVIDDSRTLVFDDGGWLRARVVGADAGAHDLYFMGYAMGHSPGYRAALRDYTAVSGRAPLLPRWALGNWWSRYWAYSDAELRALMAEFRDHDTPLSVCIIDMDWHLVDVGEGVSGWTGYTWNPALFPDPPGFIAWLHEQGLRTALNLHPALGIRQHEAAYSEMGRRLEIDVSAGNTIPFDIANPRFADAYFEVLHHPLEEMGIDFWWMDWQQGTETALGGLDPLWWLNHLHFYDLARDGKRPFIFSRWGGLGNHRYPIGFSGDTIVSWASLAFQPYMTATAANVAYGWWSHDIGGHMRGIEDGELFARWVQFGVFSPIFRLHSTKNPFHERRPWAYDAEVGRVARDAMQLRHALIPYLYTLSRLDETEAVSPVRPMYHDYPDRDEAYACPDQYLFGDLIVAPFITPADPDTRQARAVVWLPPGDWYHFFSGQYYRGDAWHAVYGGLDDIPVFARAGAIVPLGPRVGWGGVDNPTELHVHVFAGADGRFTLYEDDGETTAYRDGAFVLSRFEQRWSDKSVRLSLAAAAGDRALLPDGRHIHLHLHGLAAPDEVTLLADGQTRPVAFSYDAGSETVHLAPLAPDGAGVQLALSAVGPLLSRRDRTAETGLRLLRAFRLDAAVKGFLALRLNELPGRPERLADFGVDLTPGQVRALLEVTQGVGAHVTRDDSGPLLLLWNNDERPGFIHHLAEIRPLKWYVPERYRSSSGVVPRFMALRTETREWRLTADYFGQARYEATGD